MSRSATNAVQPTPADTRTTEMAWLRTRLLAEGLRVELGAQDAARAKPMLRVRSGSCGGMDLILPDGTWVNAPVRERFARTSRLGLMSTDDGPRLHDGERVLPVELVPSPAYYARQAASGVSMRSIGQLCSDRLGVGITNICTYFRSRKTRCGFCSIGLNLTDEHAHKQDGDILETVLAALADPVAPARHVLLGGGTPQGPDAGALRMASLAAAIRERSEVPIYAMLVPPRDLGLLDALADAGVDEIGLNIETFSEEAARRHIPAKHAAVPHAAYWRALEHCVARFGPINTRSISVVGLEPPEVTVAGVARLAAIGVLPILSPLRPLEGTELQDHPRLSAQALWELTLEAAEAADRHDMPLGPTCIACQSNTLTLPGHPSYCRY